MMGRRIVLQGREAPRPLSSSPQAYKFNSEQHAFNHFFKRAPNTLPYRVTYPAGGTAVGLMSRLRQLGVRAHFWI